MSERINRFKKRKEIINKNKSIPLVSGVVDQEAVEVLLSQSVDHGKIDRLKYSTDLSYSLDVDPDEVKDLLSDLKNSFDKHRLEQLLDETKEGIISSIVGPFGLGKVLSAYDKSGGNIDTIHNVRQGVYATVEEELSYENRGEYNSHEVHSDERYISVNREGSTKQKSTGLEDSYSDNKIYINDDKNLDHVVSAKKTHDDPGRVLAGVSTEELANIEPNLKSTRASVNKSKGAKSPEEFASYLEATESTRKERMEDLNNLNRDYTDKERKELKKLTELDAADPQKIREEGIKSQEAQNKKINEYYRSDKFLKNSLGAGVSEGAKMGAQQAFGVLLVELLSNSFIEIRSAFNNGLEGDTLYKDVQIRLERIGRNTAEKWKDVIKGFTGGFISGFISSLITTLINVFVTTGKRLVRVIREGIFSLLKALKLILSPPVGMTYREAMHEAMKLIAAGGMIVAGVALEEIIENFVFAVPFLVPFGTVVTAVIVGSLTAIAIALITYLIDKMDILSIIKIEETKYILTIIDGDIGETLKRCEGITQEIDELLLQNNLLLPAGS